MSTATMVFLVIGGLGVGILGLALVGAGILQIGHPDIDGPVSLETVAAFLGAFGFSAAIVNELIGGGSVGAVAGAAGGGVAAAIPASYLAIRMSKAAQAIPTDPTPTRSDLIGTLGVVVTAIPIDGYGEVRVRLGGQPVKLNARAQVGIPLGAHIFVIDAPSDTSVVVEQTPPLAQ